MTDTQERQAERSADEPDPRRWRALAVCLVGGFMVLLDVSIVNVALPSIRDGLQASESELQWVVSGYALTFGLLLVPAGRIGDVRGRARCSSSPWGCSRWPRWPAGSRPAANSSSSRGSCRDWPAAC